MAQRMGRTGKFMVKFFLGLIPWWAYALIAWGFASLTVPFYNDYARDQADLKLALAVGPPAAIPVSSFRGPGVTPLDEVHLSGVIRADLGINEISGDTTSRSFVVIGPQNDGGPLVALITSTTRFERMLNGLLSNAGSNGSVTVQGVLTTVGSSDVRAALARQGEGSRVYLVEPFVNGREAALQGKAQDSMIILAISAGFTLVTALAALFKFRAWRRRRARRKAARRPVAPAMPTTMPATSPAAAPAGATMSPWGAPAPENNVSAATENPQHPPQAPVLALELYDEDPVDIPPEPEFKSVFPGGGSSFRFKSTDQIIRQSFGTFRTRKQLATRIESTNDDH